MEKFDDKEFWDAIKRKGERYEEISHELLKKMVCLTYKKEYVKRYFLDDIVYNTKSGKYMLKWQRRYEPLTEKEYEEDFGKNTHNL